VSNLICVYAKDKKLKVAVKTRDGKVSAGKSFNTGTAGATGVLELVFGELAKDCKDGGAEVDGAQEQSPSTFSPRAVRRMHSRQKHAAMKMMRVSLPAVQLAVKIQPATGPFWRTAEVLFSPRYVLLNRLGTRACEKHMEKQTMAQYVGKLQIKAAGTTDNKGMVELDPQSEIAQGTHSRTSFNFLSSTKHNLTVRVPADDELSVAGGDSDGPDDLWR
jgi:hypothetical protein